MSVWKQSVIVSGNCRMGKQRSWTARVVGAVFTVVILPAQASTFISHTVPLHYELPIKVQTKCAEQQNCPEIDVKYLQTDSKWINDKVNRRITTLVIDSKPSEASPVKTTERATDIKVALNDFVAAQFSDAHHKSIPYSLTVFPVYLGHVDDFELFDIQSYAFLGGAHGMPYSEYLIFDSRTKKQILLTDLLQTGKKARFQALAYHAYQAWVKTVSNDAASYEKNWPFKLSEDVTLTKKGIDIRYQPYEIGPYAYGMPNLSVPYSKLNGIIKPGFLPK